MFFSTEDGISFGTTTQPLCLPTTSNEDPKKWQNRKVEVVCFATKDFSGSRGDVMKVAELDVFTQRKCNAKLDAKLKQNKECKFM